MEIDIIVEFFILSLFHHRKNVEVKFFLSIKQKKFSKKLKKQLKNAKNAKNSEERRFWGRKSMKFIH